MVAGMGFGLMLAGGPGRGAVPERGGFGRQVDCPACAGRQAGANFTRARVAALLAAQADRLRARFEVAGPARGEATRINPATPEDVLARTLVIGVGISSQVDRAVAAHRAWGKDIPGMVWVMEKPCPELEAAGARVEVVTHAGFEPTYDRMAWRMLDVWHHAWNRLAEPRHDWFVRVWDDSAVWVEGMRRELAGSEMMPCCSSDRAVAISQPPTIGEQFRGRDLPYVHGGAALVLSREAMRRFMNGDAGSSTNGTALHRDWALRRCSQRHVNPVMCKHAEDILVGFALLRSGVRFRYSTGISAHSTLSRHGDRLNGDAVVACEIPIAGQYSRTGEIAGVWSVHYVDAARQADWVAAMQSACLPGLASEAKEVFDALRAEAPMVTRSDFIGADEASPENEDKARPGWFGVLSGQP
ncbi:hypothetical protein FNF27_02431 [Cafeteria roenbergensis]|uniref:Hexosyltransferase n=1 Tax=Cafeteria roenbergensis TaxID=33653 RepID=A0A5A8EEP2_CAFRO|nr:hypothetical protein FNF27_02431 [Cafeteria roenbergensis]